MIWDMCDTLKIPIQNEGIIENEVETDTASFLLTIAWSDLSQLVTVRRVHQTKRAANSVKMCASPHDATPAQPPGQTDRQRLCVQMAEVIVELRSSTHRLRMHLGPHICRRRH